MSDDLVGRESLVDALSEVMVSDRDAALLIVGERGIGKTAALLATQNSARAVGRCFVETAGSAAETDLPFAALHRLLRPLLPAAQRLPDVQRRALLAALGLLDDRTRDSLVIYVAAMTLLLQAAGSRGLVVTVDDTQWLDDETRHFLTFLARRLDRHGVVIVAAAAATSGEPILGQPFREVLLHRLGEADAHRVVARHAPDLDRARRLWVVEQAAGNPLALRELATTAHLVDVTTGSPFGAVWPLSGVLERAFAGNLCELSTDERDTALVAAVGSDADLQEILAASAVLRGKPVGPAVLDRPRALGLFSASETEVLFAHPLVRMAIVQQESTSRRQAAHRALGTVVTRNAYRRAWHLALGTVAHDDSVAADLEAAAHGSIARRDLTGAIAALERAAQLSTAPVNKGRRLVLAAAHAARLGQADAVRRLLTRALAGELSDVDLARAELLRDDVDTVVIADSNRIVQLCDLATAANEFGETALCTELLNAAAQDRSSALADSEALNRLIASAVDVASADRSAYGLAVLALADPVGHGQAVLSRLSETNLAAVDDGEELSAYAVAAHAVGDYLTAAEVLDRAEVTLRAQGLLGPLARNLALSADLRVDLGNWDRAAAALIGFRTLSTSAMSSSHCASALATEAKIAALRGDVAKSLQRVSETEHSPAARSGSRYLARAQIVRGIALLSDGKHHDAYLALSRVFDPADPSHHFREQFDGVAYLAEAASHCGRQAHARRIIERMRSLTDAAASPMLAAQFDYADAVLAPDEEAELLFIAALASDAGGSRWLRARTQLAFGRWLRRRQHVTRSRGPLHDSLIVLQQLGAARWAAEAMDELTATGLRSDEPTAPATQLLSNQELAIARFAARGLSNREIGQQLHLSPRTVSSHLYRIFPKLGISTRGQIAARLGELMVCDTAPTGSSS